MGKQHQTQAKSRANPAPSNRVMPPAKQTTPRNTGLESLQRQTGNKGTLAWLSNHGMAQQLQTKLTINQAGDRHQREADGSADRIMAGQPTNPISHLPADGYPLPNKTNTATDVEQSTQQNGKATPSPPKTIVQRSTKQAQRTPPIPSLADTMANYFHSLPRPVQQILRRYSVYEVEHHPNGRWTMHRTEEQPFMDLTGGAELLFKLHQLRAYEDYLVLLEQLFIPELTQRQNRPVTPAPTHSRSITEPLMWVRNPPPGLRNNRAYARRLDVARAQIEPLLQRESTRQRRSRLTNEGVAGRPSYAFIMGTDRAGSRNQFYSNARRYYAHMPNVTVVNNLRTLEDVLDHIRRLPADQPIGTIYIISHAHRSGTINFGLNGESQEHHFGAQELEDAIEQLDITPLNTHAVDADTRIIIRGCDVGQDAAILNQLRTAFGGQATVLAPVHKQIYLRQGNAVAEGMARSYWIEYPARPPLSTAQRQAKLAAKYPGVPPVNWPQWMRDDRWVSLINDTFTYTLSYQQQSDVPSGRAAQSAAIRASFNQYDEYSWTFRTQRVRGDANGEYHLVGTGTRSTYSVSRPILDEGRYWIEYPSRTRPSLAQRQARLQSKYPQVSPANWQVWTQQRGWTHTDTIRREVTRDYASQRDIPASTRTRAEVIRSQFPRFDEYSWTFRVRRAGSGNERRYQLVGNGSKTRYTVSGLHEFGLGDPTAYGIDERPLPDAATTAVPWLP